MSAGEGGPDEATPAPTGARGATGARGDPRRALPAVDALAAAAPAGTPPPLARLAAKRVLREVRAGADEQDPVAVPDAGGLTGRLDAALARSAAPRRVLNATGVLLHTNLGRAPLDPLEPADSLAIGATDLELDLGSGRRGMRQRGVEDALCALTGAEDALVVNNGSAALVLALAALAGDGEVVISRGQLVEIGGSFRVPDVVTSGGARLHEVGTTNRTHPDDYRGAIGPDTRVLLEVHPSNYEQRGFVARVPTTTLAAIAGEHDLAVVVDLGSGLLDDRCPWLDDGPPTWLTGEPAARQTLRAGADLVTFSGDKLLGGPQAGIVCGRADLVAALRRHPLARALRYDKLRGAWLHHTLDAYLRGTVGRQVPFWRLATAPLAQLRERAASLVGSLPPGLCPTAVDAHATAGAGSTPGRIIPDVAVALTPDPTASGTDGTSAADALAAALRREGVLAVISTGRLLIHLRSLAPEDDRSVANAIRRAAGAPSTT